METAAGILLIVTPLLFGTAFGLLSRDFDYPDILREPTDRILTRFEEGGTRLLLIWHAFALSAVPFVATVVLLGEVLAADGLGYVPVATVFGILAAAVQLLGLLRWPYLVPQLARAYTREPTTDATKEAVLVTFEAAHRYLGVGVGEHLGYLFTGLWSVLIGAAIIHSDVVSAWLGWAGIVLGAAMMVSSAEFAGPFERRGWKLAGQVVPVAYSLWGAWLLVVGVVLLVS